MSYYRCHMGPTVLCMGTAVKPISSCSNGEFNASLYTTESKSSLNLPRNYCRNQRYYHPYYNNYDYNPLRILNKEKLHTSTSKQPIVQLVDIKEEQEENNNQVITNSIKIISTKVPSSLHHTFGTSLANVPSGLTNKDDQKSEKRTGGEKRRRESQVEKEQEKVAYRLYNFSTTAQQKQQRNVNGTNKHKHGNNHDAHDDDESYEQSVLIAITGHKSVMIVIQNGSSNTNTSLMSLVGSIKPQTNGLCSLSPIIPCSAKRLFLNRSLPQLSSIKQQDLSITFFSLSSTFQEEKHLWNPLNGKTENNYQSNGKNPTDNGESGRLELLGVVRLIMSEGGDAKDIWKQEQDVQQQQQQQGARHSSDTSVPTLIKRRSEDDEESVSESSRRRPSSHSSNSGDDAEVFEDDSNASERKERSESLSPVSAPILIDESTTASDNVGAGVQSSFLFLGPVGKKRRIARERLKSGDSTNPTISEESSSLGFTSNLIGNITQQSTTTISSEELSSLSRKFQSLDSSKQGSSPTSSSSPSCGGTESRLTNSPLSPKNKGTNEDGVENRRASVVVINTNRSSSPPTTKQHSSIQEDQPLNLSITNSNSPPLQSATTTNANVYSINHHLTTGQSVPVTNFSFLPKALGEQSNSNSSIIISGTGNALTVLPPLILSSKSPRGGQRNSTSSKPKVDPYAEREYDFDSQSNLIAPSERRSSASSSALSIPSPQHFSVPSPFAVFKGNRRQSGGGDDLLLSDSYSAIKNFTTQQQQQQQINAIAEANANSNSSTTGSTTSGKRKLQCPDCGKEFSQLRNFRYHRSRHEGTSQFACTCPICGKQFNDKGYLSSHLKIHRNAKEYQCEWCSKSFNQRVAYNMHVRIHTGHKPHKCSLCPKAFSRKMLLRQHLRTHTGERPYSCEICQKAFADRSNMLLHQRLHSGQRPYKCDVCGKSFSKNHHLKTHLNHHAGIKPYKCEKCSACFSQSSNMKTHFRKCTGVPSPGGGSSYMTTSNSPLLLSPNSSSSSIHSPAAPMQSPSQNYSAAAAAAAAAVAAAASFNLPNFAAAAHLLQHHHQSAYSHPEHSHILSESQIQHQIQQQTAAALGFGFKSGKQSLASSFLHLGSPHSPQSESMMLSPSRHHSPSPNTKYTTSGEFLHPPSPSSSYYIGGSPPSPQIHHMIHSPGGRGNGGEIQVIPTTLSLSLPPPRSPLSHMTHPHHLSGLSLSLCPPSPRALTTIHHNPRTRSSSETIVTDSHHHIGQYGLHHHSSQPPH